MGVDLVVPHEEPVVQKKGLAGKDYIHFSNAGSKFASQMFYNALMAEYGKWNEAP